jgi:hypothetical protein
LWEAEHCHPQHPESVTIVVSCATVNDPPTFNRGNATVTVAEDSGAYNATWATNISAGPGELDPLAFTLNCSSANSALFATPPAMDVQGRLTFTPAPDMFGNATCTVRLTEQIPGGLSATAPLLIVVTPGKAPSAYGPLSGAYT